MKAAIPGEEIPDMLDESLSQKSSNTDFPWPPFKLSEPVAVSHHLSTRSPTGPNDPPFNVENENDARPPSPFESSPENEHFPTERGIIPSAALPARKAPSVRIHPADDSIVPPTETQSSSSSNSQPPSGDIGASFGDAVAHDDAPSEERLFIDAPIQPTSDARPPSLTSLMKQSKSSIRSLKHSTVHSPSKPSDPPVSQPRPLSPPTDGLLDENCSADATAGSSSRPMGPLPVYSPSKFKLLLTESAEDEDNVEDFSTAAVASADQDDEDYVPSSIEQFSSPHAKRTKHRDRRAYRLRKPSRDDDGENDDGDEMRNSGRSSSGDDDGEIRKKGEKLAALAALKRAKEKVKRIRKPLVLPKCVEFKETLEEIYIGNSSHGAFMDNGGTMLEEEGNNQESMNGYEEGGDEEEIAQLEKDFIDLTGGAQHEDYFTDIGADNLNPLLLRMEEEETTQDLLLEMEALNAARATRQDAVQNGFGLVSNPHFCREISSHYEAIEDSRLSSTLSCVC
jgi:hypothetical protein